MSETDRNRGGGDTLPNSRLLGAVLTLREAIKASHQLRELARRHRRGWANAGSLINLADKLEALLQHEDELLTADEPVIPERFNASSAAMAELRDVAERLVSCSRALRYYAGQLEHTDADVQALGEASRRLQEYSRAIHHMLQR